MQSSISIHLDLCFWSSSECNCNIHSAAASGNNESRENEITHWSCAKLKQSSNALKCSEACRELHRWIIILSVSVKTNHFTLNSFHITDCHEGRAVLSAVTHFFSWPSLAFCYINLFCYNPLPLSVMLMIKAQTTQSCIISHKLKKSICVGLLWYQSVAVGRYASQGCQGPFKNVKR